MMFQISQSKRILALLLTLIIFLVALPAAAAKDLEESNLVSFNVTGFYIDGESASTPNLTVRQDALIDIDIRFFLSDGTEESEAEAGDFFVFSLPSALTDIATFTATETSLYITNRDTGSEVEAGTLSLSSEGRATVTFTNASYSSIEGNIGFSGKFEKECISGEEPVEFSLVAGGAIYRIGFEPNPEPVATAASLTKSGEYLAEEQAIRWTVRAKADVDVSNVTVVDTLDLKHQYIPGSSVGMDEPDYASVDGPLTFALGSLNAGVEKSFTYETKLLNSAYNLTEGQKASFSNTAVLQIGTEPVATASSAVDVTTDWIHKSGAYGGTMDVEGQAVHYIDWTVTVNNNYRTVNSPVTFEDRLAAGLFATETSFLVSGPDSGASAYTVTQEGYSVVFGQLTGPNTIQFRTLVDNDYYDQQDQTQFQNTASITVGGSTYEAATTIGVGTSLLKKTGAAYDPATQRITWKLEVNQNGRVINGAVITDSIPAGQEFVIDSVRMGTEVQAYADMPAAGYTYTEAGKLLTIGLGNLNKTDKPVVMFQTRVTNSADIATNHNGRTYYNAATLSSLNLNNAKASGSRTVTSQVIAKAGNGYNYTTRELSWKITVNQNKMVLPNVVVTDAIPAGQEFVTGSLLIGGSAPADGVLAQNGNTLALTLGTLTAQQEITFKTKVADDAVFLSSNGNVTFKNKAVLASQYAAQVPSNEASISVSNTALNKRVSEDYTADNGYIEWLVEINSNQAELVDAYLGDTLQDGLELDTESVLLYQWNQSANNTMTKGDIVPSSAYSFTYDYQTRKFMLYLPDGPQGYQLLFKTDVKKPGMYANTISLNGYNTQPDSAQSVNRVTQQNIDYSISGVNGSITVYKENMSGSRLSGAVFERLDSRGNVLDTKTTDSAGKVVFDKLKLRTYYIREKTAPADYSLNTESVQVVLTDDSAETRNKTVTIKNELLPTPAPEETPTPTPGATATPTPAATPTVTPTPVPRPNSGGGNSSRVTPTPKPNTGSVEVTVDKRVPPGSKLDVYDKDGRLVATVETGKDGKAGIPNLPYGEYTVRLDGGEVGFIITGDNARQTIALGPGGFLEVPKTGDGGKTLLALCVFLIFVGDVALAIRSVHGKRRN